MLPSFTRRLTHSLRPARVCAWQTPSVRFFAAPTATPNESTKTVPVTFVSMDGQRSTVQARIGETLLQTAFRHKLPIPGDCGGGGLGADRFSEGPTCRSCHIYVDNEHLPKLPPKVQEEIDMTQKIFNKTTNSRFACELIVNDDFQNMTVVIPDYSVVDQPRENDEWRKQLNARPAQPNILQ